MTVAYDFSSAVTNDLTLYAKWTVTVPTDISLTNNTGYVSLYTASGNYTLTSSNSLYLSWPSTGASSYTIYINTENDSSTATESTATEVSATSYGISLYNSGTKKYLVYNLALLSN